MARRYSVSPVLPPGKRSYTAYFRTASGKRVGRGLNTTDHRRAQTLCSGLTILWLSGAKTRIEAPPVEPECLDLFFDDESTEPAGGSDALRSINVQLSAEDRLERAHAEIARLRQGWDREHEAHEALKRSSIARLAEAGRRAPALDKALEQYAAHIRTKTTPGNASALISAAKRFREVLPAEIRTLADVTPDRISAFLDARAAEGAAAKKKSRRRAWYLKVARLINWSAQTWGYPSAMEPVAKTPKGEVLAERGDIHWHDLAEVEAALAGISVRLKARGKLSKDQEADPAAVAYWRALVGMLAFAGLQLAELVWLRREDLQLDAGAGRGRVWVTTVADVEDPRARHAVKTSHRRRHVDLHPRYLIPLLRSYLPIAPTGPCLFPLPAGMKRRKRSKTPGAGERWRVDGLSRVLRGDPGGKAESKGRKPKKPTPGLLPAGMNAKSLRRTFGSLLLRSGKSAADVAAAMGNTEEMVRQHYARILGCEVDVDF